MNIYIAQFGKEWNLYLKKMLIKFMYAFLLGAAAGFLLVNLVCALDKDNTSYIYGASIFAMIFAGVWLFVIGNALNTHFQLGVSMGQKRKNLIGTTFLFLVVLSVAGYAAVNIMLFLESVLYPVIFAGLHVEGGWLFPSMMKWGLLIIGFVVLAVWLLFVLYLRYGAKVFWIPYIIYMAVFLIGMKFSETEAGRILGEILMVISQLPAAAWFWLCVAADVLIVLIGSRILMKIDVK